MIMNLKQEQANLQQRSSLQEKLMKNLTKKNTKNFGSKKTTVK